VINYLPMDGVYCLFLSCLFNENPRRVDKIERRDGSGGKKIQGQKSKARNPSKLTRKGGIKSNDKGKGSSM